MVSDIWVQPLNKLSTRKNYNLFVLVAICYSNAILPATEHRILTVMIIRQLMPLMMTFLEGGSKVSGVHVSLYHAPRSTSQHYWQKNQMVVRIEGHEPVCLTFIIFVKIQFDQIFHFQRLER
jgi:hypothetical protein